MTLPGLIWLIIFYYIPVLGNVVAFKKFKFSPEGGFVKSILESEWVGFNNFKFLFSSSAAYTITRNTILYNLAFIVIGLVFAVGFAVILSQLRNKLLVKTVQTTMLLPYFLSWVIVSAFVYAFLSPDKGLVNKLLLEAGTAGKNWYVTPSIWPPFMIFINIWKNIGYSSIIYFAAIVGIDRTYYEAAEMDGATKWQQIWHVMLPQIVPMMIILTILGIGNIFRADFGLFYQIPRQSGPLSNVTSVLDTYIYNGLKNSGNIGMATAAGLYQSFVGFILLFSANLVVRKIDKDAALF
ncbi:MAG: ABC transporter permease subunit [Aerococcaceae bacterium]|nr:ABC transporter permease subunit [Aerococcaceae bacterium]